MLQKTPKPALWKFVKSSAKALFIIEAVLFACSYGVYSRMNTNREFREYIHTEYPYLLEGFYKVGELLGDSKQRDLDAYIWETSKKTANDSAESRKH